MPYAIYCLLYVCMYTLNQQKRECQADGIILLTFQVVCLYYLYQTVTRLLETKILNCDDLNPMVVFISQADVSSNQAQLIHCV